MSEHKKRITIPKSWPVARKIHTWAAKPSPGPHSGEDCLPITFVIRDMLKLADNTREAKRILHEGSVLVDGKPRKDPNFPVGIFDVIGIPAMEVQYRMLKDAKGKFHLSLLEPGKVRKLARVDNKTIIKGNRLQLNLSDGTNKLVEGQFKTGDSLILSIPEKGIEDHIPFQPGNLAMVVGGTHSGQMGTIKEIIISRSSQPNRVTISATQGEFDTIQDYVFMIGRDEPVIKLGVR